MGAVRTTYAMVAACIVRRKQCIELGLSDPYAKDWKSGAMATGGFPLGAALSSSPSAHSQAAYILEQGMYNPHV